MQWMIYERSREYARETGDPVLGIVEADTKEQAEESAWMRGIPTVSGPLAVPVPVIVELQDYAFLVLYFVHTAPGRVLYISGLAQDAQTAQRRVAEKIHGLGAGRTPLGFKIWRRGSIRAVEEPAREVREGMLVTFPTNERFLYGVVEGLPYPGSVYYVIHAVTVTGFGSLILTPRDSFALLD